MPRSARKQRKAAAPISPPAPPAAQPAPPASTAKRWWLYPAASILALVPCYWQPRIQAGDLGSHVYNAWLAQLIGLGKAPGLSIVPQSTNVLFDLLLSALFNAFGAAAAQRIAVSLAVLVFVWGAFAFCRAAAGRAWPVFPVLMALAYGWVFHMGFFNFYLGLGLSLWALALAWKFQPKGLAAALACLAAAYVAEALPVVWAVGVLGFVWMARRWPRHPFRRLAIGLGGVAALRLLLDAAAQTRWKPQQFEFFWGAGELWVYPVHVAAAALALAALWGVQIAMMARRGGSRPVFGGEVFQVCALMAAGILIIPDWVNLWYRHPVVFLAQRMALPLAVCLCALVAGAPLRRWSVYAASAVAVLFFATLYFDERALNRFEDAEEVLVTNSPFTGHIVNGIEMPDEHVNALTHMIDRVCVGRCYSWGNYEPSSGQFRIRVTGPQNIVAPVDDPTWQLQAGSYVVRPEDPPLLQVEVRPDGTLYLRRLPVGRPNRLTFWDGLR